MARSPPEILAQRWVPGEGPVEVQPLGMGLVNSSWRVARSGKRYFLRVAAGDSRQLGLDREWEMRVLQVAAAADIAPSVIFCDPAEGILVSDWLAGQTWTATQIAQADNQLAMARLLRRVHALSILGPARIMNPAAWISHYRTALAALPRDAEASPGLAYDIVERLAAAAEHMLGLLASSIAAAPVMCHSDLHRLNVSVGARIRLLDWEYAHFSDRYWDLAGWACNNDWTTAQAECFLDHYLERPAQSAERSRLHVWMWLYDYVSLLWSLLYAAERRASTIEEVFDRLHLIAGRLTHGQGLMASRPGAR